MAGNIFGNIFTLTTFGESHGNAIGGVIDGFPAGIDIDMNFIQKKLNKRRPGSSNLVSKRNETDKIEILSGIFKGKSIGTPIAFIIKNNNAISQDYNLLQSAFRPSHADYTYQKKYGIRDYRGGGRSSARETATRVAAGAFAQLLLQKLDIKIMTWTSSIGSISLDSDYNLINAPDIEKSPVGCPNKEVSTQMAELIKRTGLEGDTLGGIINCVVKGVPVGLGEPVFDKLHADIGKAMLSINAAKGFEIGEGFAGAQKRGSEMNDIFVNKDRKIETLTNHSGGVQGGISNGEDIFFKVAFKPVATLMQAQYSVDELGNHIVIEPKGRHDVCVVPRAIPIVEAMTALVLADHYLRNFTAKI